VDKNVLMCIKQPFETCQDNLNPYTMSYGPKQVCWIHDILFRDFSQKKLL